MDCGDGMGRCRSLGGAPSRNARCLPGVRRTAAASIAADGRLSAVHVQVGTDDELAGLFGANFAETVLFIPAKVTPYLLNQDLLTGECLRDVLYCHARMVKQRLAISAVDCTLRDLRGKALGLMVYRLLGGPTRQWIDCYASMLGDSLDPDSVRDRARWAAT